MRDQWKRAQQDPFDPTENGCGGADPQCQAEDREYGKARTTPEHANAKSKVLKHISYQTPHLTEMSRPRRFGKCGGRLRISAHKNSAGTVETLLRGNFVACHHFCQPSKPGASLQLSKRPQLLC